MTRLLLGQTDEARILVLISGTGSNLQALIDACGTPDLPGAKIVRVISDRKAVRGLQRAQEAGIPTTHHGVIAYKRQHPAADPAQTSQQAREAYDADLAKLVTANEPHIVICAGFMRILTPAFLDPIAQAGIPTINLHPAKPDDLVGANCIERAWEEFLQKQRTESGIMIHYVITEVDRGAPIVWEAISMADCSSLDEFTSRVHEHEHHLIVRGTKMAIDALRSPSDP